MEKLQEKLQNRHSDNNLQYIKIEEEIEKNPDWPPVSESSVTLADLMRQESNMVSVDNTDTSAATNDKIGLDVRKPRQDSVSSYENQCYFEEGDTLQPDSPKDPIIPLLPAPNYKHDNKSPGKRKKDIIREESDIAQRSSFIDDIAHSTAL